MIGNFVIVISFAMVITRSISYTLSWTLLSYIVVFSSWIDRSVCEEPLKYAHSSNDTIGKSVSSSDWVGIELIYLPRLSFQHFEF